eukprot:6988995-Pyramimonas_sp.AAC.1
MHSCEIVRCHFLAACERGRASRQTAASPAIVFRLRIQRLPRTSPTKPSLKLAAADSRSVQICPARRLVCPSLLSRSVSATVSL